MSFTYRDFLVDLPNAPREAYRSTTEEDKLNFKWGQRKLLVHELFFLTMSIKSMQKHLIKSPPQQITCIYVGAAPGTHIVHLLELFLPIPIVRFKLYDFREFDPKLKAMTQDPRFQGRLQLTSGSFFTDEMATQLKKDQSPGEVFLYICDIRSTKYDSNAPDKQAENDRLVREDMARQLKWHLILQPYMSSLKFRLPFTYQPGETFSYVDGYLYHQCYTGSTSSETRLVTNTNKMVEYDIQQYEEVMFYHNRNKRPRELNYYADQDFNDVFDGSYDSSMEIYVWTYFMQNILGKTKITPLEVLSRGLRFDQIIGRSFEQQRINITDVLVNVKEKSLKLQEIAQESAEESDIDATVLDNLDLAGL